MLIVIDSLFFFNKVDACIHKFTAHKVYNSYGNLASTRTKMYNQFYKDIRSFNSLLIGSCDSHANTSSVYTVPSACTATKHNG